MKRFYLATPTKYEDEVIENLGALGTVQLITDYTVNGFKRVDTVEKCEKYVKLQQRITSVLSTLPAERAKKSGLQSFKDSFSKPIQRTVLVLKISLDEIDSEVAETEKELDGVLGRLEKSRGELKTLKATEEKLLILQKHGLKPNDLGSFGHIFVKAGFINRALSGKLQKYIEGTSVRFARWPDKREDDFVLVLGLNRDMPLVEETLTRLNFAELNLPSGLSSDTVSALDENHATASKVGQEIAQVEKEVRGICGGFQGRAANFTPIVSRALSVENARSTFSRTGTLSLVHGWIPAKHEESLKSKVAESTKGAVYLKFDKPALDEQVPAQINNKGVAGSFELFTRLRGTPLYAEVDPTKIVTVLFTIMYGMMFGDVGQGIVLLAIGLMFRRLQRSFLGIPARAMSKLGGILATCGISAICFGALYGEFFLSDAFHPLYQNPIQGQSSMIIVALLFGVFQMSLGLVLKIINLIRTKAMIAAAFGGVRLLYYAVGVVLAVKYVSSMSFAVFTQNLLLTVIAIACLGILFFSPTIESVIEHEKKLVESIMKGASEFIETFLSYLTNSISYVRLAAFAIAHSALGVAALTLGATIGSPAAFIMMNALALTIEALGVFIQCMRLTYYEFFTRFYSGTGLSYRPFSLPKIFGTVN
jgi:V/A-type H+-transporting ATPase subunit I